MNDLQIFYIGFLAGGGTCFVFIYLTTWLIRYLVDRIDNERHPHSQKSIVINEFYDYLERKNKI